MSSRLIAVAGGLLLSACNTVPPQAGSLDAGIGEATKYNAAVQIINPEPVYAAASAQPGDSGAKAAEASKRYRADAVKEPQLPSTKKSGASGGPR